MPAKQSSNRTFMELKLLSAFASVFEAVGF